MYSRTPLSLFLFLLLFLISVQSKSTDPYKVLGVDKTASQREIQKAFHKLSLQYHPDKNKNKGAQEKFAEINNAYGILSDEEKRKNYDLYGDKKGTPGFDGGPQGGYSHFTGGGPGGFSFRPDEWQNMGGQGGQKSFSFSFGGPSSQKGQRSFGFGMDDIFSNFFGSDMGGGNPFGGGFGGSARPQSSSKSSPKSITSVNSQVYKKEIAGKGITWLLLSYTPSTQGTRHHESIMEEVAGSLQGALKVGSINCGAESSLCKELNVYPRRTPRLFVYSYKASETGAWIEYDGDQAVKSLKSFCQDHMPRFSKRVNLAQFEPSAGTTEPLPKVILLSTKKDTPVIWRALSGLYRNRVVFYDAEVHDVSYTMVRKLGVDALPAVVGWLSNGERHILKTGISVKDLKSAINDLSGLLDGFEKKNKKVASQSKKSESDTGDSKQIPLLTGSNFDAICGDKVPVCIIGAFRSSRSREKLENVLSLASQKSLVRRRNVASGSDSISYALLDASKQSSFLNSFDKLGFKSSDKLLLAYKPKKGKFAAYVGEITTEEVEKFIGSVLNGDVQFTNTRQKPSVN